MTNEERNLPVTNLDANVKDSKGKTPLMREAENGDIEIVKTLFDGRADVDEGMKIVALATANPASGFIYTKSDGEITITELKNGKMLGDIPSTIDGQPVTSIGEEAFDNCNKLTIRTPKGSAAEKYAKENEIDVVTTSSSSR